MGINVSHGGNHRGHSGLSISQLGQQLAHVLPSSDWREIKHLFGGTFADVVEIAPKRAARIAKILHRAAGHAKFQPYWGDMTRQLADSAASAARAGEPWVWS
jgi:hypothetical protein